MAYVSRDVSAENQFTDPVRIVGEFNLSISGTFVATVTVQRSFDGGVNWLDIASWSEPFEGWDREPLSQVCPTNAHTVQYRAGVKTGEFTSGTVSIILGQS